ncbi:hypothetical protein Vretifemale_12633 [Volvox reticuliferus]|nr:hypothetical protein Vretifemale_12633 [Volvox reticuliferus]
MAAVQRLLGTTPSAAPKPPTSAATSAPSCLSAALSLSQPRIWAVAAARAVARAAVLAALASGLRALACDPPRLGWLLHRVLQGGFGCDAFAAAGSAAGRACGGVAEAVEAAVAAIQSLLRQPLTTPAGLLAAAAVLLGAAAAAAIAASVCGRLGGSASMRGTSNWDVNAEGNAGWRKQERPGADIGGGAPSSSSPSSSLSPPSPSPLPSVPLPASSSCVSGTRKVSASKEGQVEGNITSDIINGVVSEHCDSQDAAAAAAAHMAAAASWHAERVLVLTATATAMTALVCLNWAAAVVAGIYLAPLALWQGLTVRQAIGGSVSSTRRRWAGPPGVWLRLLKAVVWVFWNPLIFLVLFYAAAAAAGIAAGGLSSAFSRSMMQLAAHGMSTVNYWFMSVVVMSVWLFGIGRGGRGLLLLV